MLLIPELEIRDSAASVWADSLESVPCQAECHTNGPTITIPFSETENRPISNNNSKQQYLTYIWIWTFDGRYRKFADCGSMHCITRHGPNSTVPTQLAQNVSLYVSVICVIQWRHQNCGLGARCNCKQMSEAPTVEAGSWSKLLHCEQRYLRGKEEHGMLKNVAKGTREVWFFAKRVASNYRMETKKSPDFHILPQAVSQL